MERYMVFVYYWAEETLNSCLDVRGDVYSALCLAINNQGRYDLFDIRLSSDFTSYVDSWDYAAWLNNNHRVKDYQRKVIERHATKSTGLAWVTVRSKWMEFKKNKPYDFDLEDDYCYIGIFMNWLKKAA